MFDLEGDRVWTAAAGFGGGIARYQSVCGALTGAVIALGLREGGLPDDPEKKVADRVRPRARRLMDGFRERFGDVECRKLIPFDLNNREDSAVFKTSPIKQEKCYNFLRYVVETLAPER